jgi:hypothetical protein
MQQLELARPSAASRAGPVAIARGMIRPWLGGRRGLILAGVALVAAGLALGWNWLTAIGVVPLILSAAPCLAICALGACAMARGGRSSCAAGSDKPAVPPDEAAAAAPPDGRSAS